MEPDLSRLFAELNLSSHCSLEEFQRVVRRRISELHPDRSGPEGTTSDEQAELHRLLTTYSAVTRFHRRYGRMPGTVVTNRAGDVRAASVRATMVHPALQLQANAEPEHEPIDVPSARAIVLLVAIVLLLASWDWLVVQAA